MKSGQIIDATFVPVPIQRNSRSQIETLLTDKQLVSQIHERRVMAIH